MDGISELAKMLKEREQIPYIGPQIGEVVSPPPKIKVRLDNVIILDERNLVIAAHVLDGYQRTLEIAGGMDAIAGQMTFTDGLKVGDKVILIPSTDEQTYFLIDKVVIV